MNIRKIKSDSYLDEKLTDSENLINILSIILGIGLTIVSFIYLGTFGKIYGWCAVGITVYGIITFITQNGLMFDIWSNLLNKTLLGFIIFLPIIIPMGISYFLLASIYSRKYPNIKKTEGDRLVKIKQLMKKTK